jgi:hypothetical protein
VLLGVIVYGEHHPVYVAVPIEPRTLPCANQCRCLSSPSVAVYSPPNFGAWIEMLVSPGSM